MRGEAKASGHLVPRLRGSVILFAILVLLYLATPAAAEPEPSKRVVVLYPSESDGSPGTILVNRALRSTFDTRSPVRIEISNEYMVTTRFRDTEFMRLQVSLLQRKYAGRKVDLVIAGLSSGLDFALKYRDEVFPGVPIVYVAVDEREVKARRLPPDVVGVPNRMDLEGTLDLALRLHPNTRRVFVIAGAAPFDIEWTAEARQVFRGHEGSLEFIYLTGLPMDDLLGRVAHLPEGSLVYYLHIHQDGTGVPYYPADALERLAARANVPIYGHVDTYVGRGAVGGRVFTFEAEGTSAANLGLRILSGENPRTITVPERNENTYLFDARQLRRWGIDKKELPPGSVLRYKETTVWETYKWHIVGGASLFLVEGMLIAGLLIQSVMRRRAEKDLLASERELRQLTGRLLEAQEGERRRIARELHDDLNQGLALLAVELDLLGRSPQLNGAITERLTELSTRVKDLSTVVHDLSHELHPSKLEHLGLVAAIGGLCRDVAYGHELEVEFSHGMGAGQVPPETTLCLYRIVQEALRNVVKHSGSRHASVDLNGTVDVIHLRIADDGIGFVPGTMCSNEGLGLVSMRERLRMVGGVMTLDAKPGRGVRIDVRVPVPQSDLPADLEAVTSRSAG